MWPKRRISLPGNLLIRHSEDKVCAKSTAKMRKLIAALFCFLALIQGDALRAETRTIARHGGWTAFGGTTNQGHPTCGIDTIHEATGRHFLIQHYAPNDFLVVRAHKSGWQIPSGTRVRARLSIDRRISWNITADGDRNYIEWRISGSVIAEFIREFRLGLEMWLEFLDGTEPPWYFTLRGTNATFDAFATCLRTHSLRQSSQPHSRPQTQPFSRAPSAPSSPSLPPPVDDASPVGAGPGNVAGRWVGSYTCAQGLTNVTLELAHNRTNGEISGSFRFGPSSQNPEIPHGVFRVAGFLDPRNGKFSLTPQAWISQPPGYIMVGFEGWLAGNTITGSVLGAPQCSSFQISR